MEEADKCDNPNAIHRWSKFKSKAIEKAYYYKKPFQPDGREARTS